MRDRGLVKPTLAKTYMCGDSGKQRTIYVVYAYEDFIVYTLSRTYGLSDPCMHVHMFAKVQLFCE